MPPANRETVTRPEQTDIEVLHDVDVLVLGGGPAGLGAAVASARLGARTLLCERYGFLGGMATAALVSPFMANDLDGQPLDTGVFRAWCERIAALGGMHPPARELCAETAKLAAEDLCLDAGVELLYHVVLDRPLVTDQHIDSVLLLGKGGTSAHRARVYVDATGDADLAARAGCPFEQGRPEDGAVQPMTTGFDLAGVDTKRLPHPLIINAKYTRAKEQGRLDCPRENLLMFATLEPDRVHFNATRVVGADGTDTASLSAAETEGRRQVGALLRFLREEISGFEDARLHSLGTQIGVRETRRLRGRAYLELADFARGARFDDGVCRVTYPIDIHDPHGPGTQSLRLPAGKWYEVPYGCLVPLGCDNLLVGGRPISADHAVHSSLRVMPSACTLGQAAGTAAALCAEGGIAPAALDGEAVRASLIEQGVRLEG